MSILIKGIEMPTSCPCELLGIGYDLYCSFAGGIPARVKEYYECCQNDTRPSWCPLASVPPHGDLVDRREAIIDANERAFDFWLSDDEVNATIQFLKEQPTVIPEEEG